MKNWPINYHVLYLEFFMVPLVSMLAVQFPFPIACIIVISILPQGIILTEALSECTTFYRRIFVIITNEGIVGLSVVAFLLWYQLYC